MTPPMRRRARGFTLVELMAVVAIVGILAAVSAGMGGQALKKVRSNQFLRRWTSAVQVARHEAMRRGVPTAIVTLPIESRSGGWGGAPPSGRGVMVYVDTNMNGRYDGNYTGTDPSQSWAGSTGEPIVWAYPQSPSPDLCAIYGAQNADFSASFGPEFYTLYPTWGGAALFNALDPVYFLPSGQIGLSRRTDAFYDSALPPVVWAPSPFSVAVQLSNTCTTDRSNIYATLAITRIGAVISKTR